MAKEKEARKLPQKKKPEMKNRDLKPAKDAKGDAQKKEGPMEPTGRTAEIDFMKKWD